MARLKKPRLIVYQILLYILKMAELRASGLNLIREYIPDSPEYNPEDEADQYNKPYAPQIQPSDVPDYQPSAIINVPELEEEEVHVKFADPPASPPPTGDVLMETTPGTPSLPGQLHASVHPTSDAKIILHSENSGPPKGRPLQVISRGIPPEERSDTDLDEELQHPKHPIPSQDKEEGEWTDEDDIPPLIDISDDESKGKELPPDPWNDTAFDLQEKLTRWDLMEPEPDYEEYGLTSENLQIHNLQHQIQRMHRCVDEMKIKLKTISTSQEDMKKMMTQRDEVLLKITQTNRMVTDVSHSIETVSESQDSIKNILKDLYDIINYMNKYDKSDSQDFVKKMDKISRRMTQINLGQERVKEAMTDLKTSLTSPRSQKRGYYQTVECNDPHYENKVKHQKLSSNLNFAYFDKQYGEVLEVGKSREVRRGLKERFLELHEKAQKWELLAYHLKVICAENPGVEPLPYLGNDAYQQREEAYLTVATVRKLFKHLEFVTQHHLDYNSFQDLITIMFQGLVERKITPAMVYHWLTHQIFWSLCEYEENTVFDVLTDVILLYREFSSAAKAPHESDPGLYHHMPELYGEDHLFLNKLEMKCSDIMTRYCFCNFHADYPMKFGDAHKYLTFRRYKFLHEENLPVGETVTQMKLHEGYINTNLMRILHEVHGLVTPYSPQIILQEERMANLYPSFSPQEYDCLKGALGLVTVNRTLDLEKAMKILQWFKQSTCPCTQHAVRRGGQIWQLRPSTAVPTDVVLQLPALSTSQLLQRRKAVQEAKYSSLDDASSISSSETLFQDNPDDPKNVLPDLKDVYDKFNQKMKKVFQNPTIQEMFPYDGLLNELCSILSKEVKQANSLKWVNHATSASNEVNELIYWKGQMKQDIDSIMSQIKTKLYTGLGEMCGEMQNLFQEEEDEATQAAQDAIRMEEVD